MLPYIYVYDLEADGITDMGTFKARGVSNNNEADNAPLALYYQNKEQKPAAWPKFLVPNEEPNWLYCLSGTTTTNLETPDSRHTTNGWTLDDANNPVMIHSFNYGWIDGHDFVTGSTSTALTRVNEGGYGYMQSAPYGARYYCYNIKEELGEGETWIDRANNKIYWIPVGFANPTTLAASDMQVTTLDSEIVVCDNVDYIIFGKGMIFEKTRDHGIKITTDTSNITITGEDNGGTIIRNTGKCGIDNQLTTNGKTQNQLIERLEVYDNGEMGISMGGGNSEGLISSGNIARSNEIHHCSRWIMCFQGAIGATSNHQNEKYSCGATIINNYIHHIPNIAVGMRGTRILVKYNKFYKTNLHGSDGGVLYDSARVWNRGIQVHWNLFKECYVNVRFQSANLTSGTPIEDAVYRIVDNSGGADFSGCGAPSNDVSTLFIANGSPPTDWGTGAIRRYGDRLQYNDTQIAHIAIYMDSSSNGWDRYGNIIDTCDCGDHNKGGLFHRRVYNIYRNCQRVMDNIGWNTVWEQAVTVTSANAGTYLISGAWYQIHDNSGGADFTSSGAANNNVGTKFIYNGTPPTWGTGSLYNNGTGDFINYKLASILSDNSGMVSYAEGSPWFDFTDEWDTDDWATGLAYENTAAKVRAMPYGILGGSGYPYKHGVSSYNLSIGTQWPSGGDFWGNAGGSSGWPNRVEEIEDPLLSSGTITVDNTYIIVAAGGTFTNVGAADNNVGTVFTATGTTPTAWSTGRLRRYEDPLFTDPDNDDYTAALGGAIDIHFGILAEWNENVPQIGLL